LPALIATNGHSTCGLVGFICRLATSAVRFEYFSFIKQQMKRTSTNLHNLLSISNKTNHKNQETGSNLTSDGTRLLSTVRQLSVCLKSDCLTCFNKEIKIIKKKATVRAKYFTKWNFLVKRRLFCFRLSLRKVGVKQ